MKEYLFSCIRVLGECEEYKDFKARYVLFIGTKQTLILMKRRRRVHAEHLLTRNDLILILLIDNFQLKNYIVSWKVKSWK